MNKPQRGFTVSPKQIRALIGGNGTGKTQTLAWNIVAFLLGWHPHSHLFPPPLRLRLSGTTLREGIHRRLLPAVKNYLHPKYLIKDYDDAGRVMEIEPSHAVDAINEMRQLGHDIPNQPLIRNHRGIVIGGYVEFMTYDQSVQQHAGEELDGFGFDEEGPEVLFVENEARLRTAKNGGFGMLAMTPPLETERPMTWTWERIYGASKDSHIEVFETSMYDNPAVTPEFIKNFIATHSDTEVQVKVFGRYAQLSGLVYKDFSKERPGGNVCEHVWPRPGDSVFMALDLHESKHPAAVWIFKDQEGHLYQFMELSRVETEKLTIREALELIMEKERGLIIDYRLVGNASIPDVKRIEGFDLRYELTKLRPAVTIVPEKPIDARINATRQYIRGIGGPKLYISEICSDTIQDISHLTYKAVRNRDPEAPKVLLRDKGKCLPDCISFICAYEAIKIENLRRKHEEQPSWSPPRRSRVYGQRDIASVGDYFDALELERLKRQTGFYS